MAGTVWVESRRTFTAQEELFNTAIEDFVRSTGRTEQRNAPLVIMGELRTTGFGGYLAKKYPQRVVAYVVKVMGGQGVTTECQG